MRKRRGGERNVSLKEKSEEREKIKKKKEKLIFICRNVVFLRLGFRILAYNKVVIKKVTFIYLLNFRCY